MNNFLINRKICVFVEKNEENFIACYVSMCCKQSHLFVVYTFSLKETKFRKLSQLKGKS